MDLKLANKVVFISASGQGIGLSTAETFLQEGARVLINDVNDKRLKKTYRSLTKKYGDRVDYYTGDASDTEVLSKIRGHISKKWKKVDILVANLGSGKPSTKEMLDIPEWNRLLDVNLLSALKLIKYFLPDLRKESGGAIVMTSSIAGIQRSPAPFAYSAAKTSIISFVKNISVELAKDNIRINAVAPGNIYFKGGRWDEIIHKNPDISKNYIKNDVPMKRFGSPDEIANAIVFLSSEKSSFTTGTCLVVDGGETKGY